MMMVVIVMQCPEGAASSWPRSALQRQVGGGGVEGGGKGPEGGQGEW